MCEARSALREQAGTLEPAQIGWHPGAAAESKGAILPMKTLGYPDSTEIKICNFQLPTKSFISPSF